MNIDSDTQMLTVEKNTCNSNEALPTISLYDTVDKLGKVQLQSSGLESGSFALSAKENLSGPQIHRAFNSNSVIDCYPQTESEGKNNGGFDDVYGTGCPDIVFASVRRSARIINSCPETQAKEVLRKGKKSVKNMLHKHGIFDIFLKASRRRRSCFCKPARSSSWGLLANVAQTFVNYNCLEANHLQGKGPQIPRTSHKGKKHRKNSRPGVNVSSPVVKIDGSTCHIRLKVKVGKEVSQNSLEVIVPKTVNTLHSKQHRGKGSEHAEISDGVEDAVTGIGQHNCFSDNLDVLGTSADASLLDVYPAGKDAEGGFITDRPMGNVGDNNLISSQMDADALVGRNDNRYIDSGTSPDSEVINIAPDDQDGLKIQEGFHVDTLTSFKSAVTHENAKAPNLSNCSSQMVKKDKFSQAASSVATELLPSQSSKCKIRLSIKHGCRGEIGGGEFPSNEIFNALSSKNTLSNISRKTEFCNEILPSLTTGLASCPGVLPVEYGTDAGLYSGCGSFSGLLDSKNPKDFIPSFKCKGCRTSKNSKSSYKCSNGSKGRFEALDPATNRRKDACMQTVNQRKLSKKNRDKDMGGAEQDVCILDGCQETGKHFICDLGKDHAFNKAFSEGVSNTDMVSWNLGHISPPRSAWVCCDDCHKWRCITATLADKIEATNCKWTCKDNMDKAFADCFVPQEKSNAEINADLQISEASGEEDAREVHFKSIVMGTGHSTVAQQSSWMLIKSNLFLHRNRKKQIIDEIMVCHCIPPRNGRMGCGDGCLNRMLNIECVRGACPCGDLCSNQQFQRRKYAKVKSIKCGKKGYGLQSLQNVSPGTFLIEYVGEVLDLPAYEARQRDYASRGHRHFYFMTLNGSEVIDACRKGNLGRFINHSCDPNCGTEKWMVNGEVCIGIFSIRNIKKGEELTFDYNYVRVFGAAAKKCVCHSSQCRGYIGGDPLNAEAVVQVDSDEEYPEPLMIRGESETSIGRDNPSQIVGSCGGVGIKTAELSSNNKSEMDKCLLSQIVGSCGGVGIKTAELSSNSKSEMDNCVLTQLDVTSLDDGKSTTDVENAEFQNGVLFSHDELDEHRDAVAGQLAVIENGDSLSTSTSAVHDLQNSLDVEDSVRKSASVSQVQTLEASVQPGDPLSKCTHNVQEYFTLAEGASKESPCSLQQLDACSPSKMPEERVSSPINCKSNTIEDDHVVLKSNPTFKGHRSSSSLKKGKSSHKVLNASQSPMVTVSEKKEKSTHSGSANGRLEGVELKLNELLDADGGISKRKDSPRGYLKLLLLTAASGNSEAIQSTRDLSMILDALLKTKSRVVLADIINKNGLQMLHKILKQYRKDFNKTPVLRKLLKVLEYLVVRDILTSEHINGGPPCPGMESLRESILVLAEHTDRQVHHIARNFRDRWMPGGYRKPGCMTRDESKMELQKDSGRSSRTHPPHNSWHGKGLRPKYTMESSRQSTCFAGDCCSANWAKPHKLESRWDQPARANKKLKTVHTSHGLDSCSQHPQSDARTDDGADSIVHDDAPPGFSSTITSALDSSKSSLAVTDPPQQNFSSLKWPFDVMVVYPSQRFNSRLPVSYGIPLLTVQQYGTPLPEAVDSWSVAPGMPFHPFPPLPPLSRDKEDVCPREGFVGQLSGPMVQGIPSTSGAAMPDARIQDMNNPSCDLGRNYSRQPRLNNLKSKPPCGGRNGGRYAGNDSRRRPCNPTMGNVPINVRNMYPTEDGCSRMKSDGPACYQH